MVPMKSLPAVVNVSLLSLSIIFPFHVDDESQSINYRDEGQLGKPLASVLAQAFFIDPPVYD
jgi:hypothetical protein